MLSIQNLHISIESKPIVKGVSLNVKPGEVHAIMGPNGSGKSTLAYGLMGHPRYAITGGSVELAGEPIHELPVHERARRGLFLSFQYPMEIPGVSVLQFLRTAEKAREPALAAVAHPGLEQRLPSYTLFKDKLATTMQRIGFDGAMMTRSLNESFSGGEKKKMEMVQAEMLDPKYVILDEVDSGLDIDALKQVAETANEMRKRGKGLLVITHYARLLHHLKPDRVHVMVDGKIVKSGGAEVAMEVEEKGYKRIFNSPKF